MESVTGIAAVVLLLLGASQAANPGLRTAITDKGLDYVCQVGIPMLEQSLSSTTIPDISGSASTPVGSVDYTLTNIKMASFSIPTSSLTSGSKGLVVQASGISMAITADWSYREHSWPHISDHGSCDVSVSSVSLTVSVTVGVDSKGHATLSTTGCSITVGSLDIKFHGGASWLYNLFADYVADTLKKSIQEQVCSEARSEINSAGNAALESLPVIVPVDAISEISFALIQAPVFNTTYIETLHKGEFLSVAHPVDAPYSPPPIPPITDTSRMMYVWVTDYIANTAGLVYLQAGALKYNITPDMVPSGFPFQLNTASFKIILPQLYEKYPDMPMMLELNATASPVLKFTPAGGNFTVPGQVNVYVVPKNGTRQLAFIVGQEMLAGVYMWVHFNGTAEVISANLTFLRADLSLVYSNIGQFSVSVLQTAANLLCKVFVIPIFNGYGNTGFPIPVVDGVTFLDSTLTIGQGYAVVATDINYKPTLLGKTQPR